MYIVTFNLEKSQWVQLENDNAPMLSALFVCALYEMRDGLFKIRMVKTEQQK